MDEVVGLSDDELVDRHEHATQWANTAYRAALRVELLRRLSAGNPQAEKVADLEQKVCDFQAAAMIDVGGQGGPCLVEPRHVEAHITALRARIAELEQANGFDGSAGPEPERSDGRSGGEWCSVSSGTEAKMADWRDLSNEQLVSAHGAAGDPEGHYTAADLEDLGAELLRRLSAGNPQAEKVQISEAVVIRCALSESHGDCGGLVTLVPLCEEHREGALGQPGPEPERSDGRVQGEEHPINTLLRQQALRWAPVTRSAGRIEAGSEHQGYEGCVHVINKCVTEAECTNKLSGEMGQ
jgi:hypothetical protein